MTVAPRIVVLSAPSGGGKTTIARAVRDRFPERFGFSVSATTRQPRAGEEHGDAYYFLSREEFLRRVERGEFLEHAEYAGELYGTLASEVDRVTGSGRHVLLDIEVEGARQVRARDGRAITIFILPSEPRVLLERLRGRKTESPAQIMARVQRAKYELTEAAGFDHWVRNDDLGQAIDDVVNVVQEGGGFRRDNQDIAWLDRYGDGLDAAARLLYDELHQQKG
ncbi:MAG: guanylate kinase [Gemmatimonadales bacterium]